LNVDKTKFKIVSSSPAELVNVRTMIDHQQFGQVGVVKYLSIQIDEKLNVAEIINFILNSSRASVGKNLPVGQKTFYISLARMWKK
jgi:hypothetical protein